MRIIYRARQFWAALTAAPTPADLAAAQRVLAPALMDLFKRMQASEQAHSLDVYYRLLRLGEQDGDLLAAALLHDVGKTCYPLHTWERVVIVVARALFPGRVKTWGQHTARGWRRAFVVAEKHAAWGAALAAEAGASPLVVELIRRHQDPRPANPALAGRADDLLRLLQQCDDES